MWGGGITRSRAARQSDIYAISQRTRRAGRIIRPITARLIKAALERRPIKIGAPEEI